MPKRVKRRLNKYLTELMNEVADVSKICLCDLSNLCKCVNVNDVANVNVNQNDNGKGKRLDSSNTPA